MSETKIYVMGGSQVVVGEASQEDPSRETECNWGSRWVEVGGGMANNAVLTGCQRVPKSWKVSTRGWIDNKLSATTIILGFVKF